jgi:methionyl-tRNA synthetase
MISINDFKKIEMTIGEIKTVEKVPDTDKLLRLTVDFGESEPRQVISGIAEYFEDIQTLVGTKCPFVTNLEPRVIRGFESQAMILAVSTGEVFSILEPTLADMPVGTTLT